MTWGDRARGPALLAAFGLAAAVLAGCSGGTSAPHRSLPPFSPTPSDSSSTSGSASVSPTPTVTVPPVGYAPLTGLPLTVAAAVTRPIVAVVVVRAPGVAGAVGLGSSDIVFQEFDRPGRSRLLALFQTYDVRSVGPVADTAPVDIRLLTPMAVPVYAYVSGPTGFIAQARPDVVTPRSAVTSPGLFRSAGGIFTSTSALRASAPNAQPAPAGLFSFDAVPAGKARGARTVSRATITVPGQVAQSWTWTGKAWAGPGGLSRTNLVVQTVVYKLLTPSKGPRVSSADVIGSGASTVLAGNVAVAGQWIRPAPAQVTNYVDSAAIPFSLMPGNSVVLLVPPGTRVTLS